MKLTNLAVAMMATAVIAMPLKASAGTNADPEDHFRHWAVNVTGQLDAITWGVELGATYRFNQYVGVGAGLLLLGTVDDDTKSGVSPNGQQKWVADTRMSRAGATRVEVALTTPQLKLGADRDYGLSLRVSPGISIPIPVNSSIDLTVVPATTGVAEKNDYITLDNKGGRAIYEHVKVAAVLALDRLEISAGYAWSDFDIYGNVRNIKIYNTPLVNKSRSQSHAGFIGLTYTF